ncbi:hypothetical protein MLD38_000009 [Melastoma candidum]|uniref:Uncharacterized protein n=1 Tax=Melastoma candidum TaxID=119954 RepID=A0ACB9S8F9_9MYRT|nr:hypothetical protein MLD38_000009 [Melastoma candidum]
MGNAFRFIRVNNGLDTELDYPYNGKEGTCNTKAVSAATITGYELVPTADEKALLQAVVNQPISVAIEAKDPTFIHYAGGVYKGPCGTDLNHAVTLVGYGTADNGTDYWLVKNSWGTQWGENGYMRIQRGVEDPKGLCGIAIYAVYPVLS